MIGCFYAVVVVFGFRGLSDWLKTCCIVTLAGKQRGHRLCQKHCSLAVSNSACMSWPSFCATGGPILKRPSSTVDFRLCLDSEISSSSSLDYKIKE